MLVNGKGSGLMPVRYRYLELVNTFVNTPEANKPNPNFRNGNSYLKNGGAEGMRPLDPLLAKRIV